MTIAFKAAAQPAPILVVDDNDGVRELACVILQSAGYQVTSAASGDEALFEIAADRAIGLLLTDIMMPGRLDGWELARWSRFLRPSLPIIYMTGYSKKPPGEQAGGFGPIMQKPWTAAQLLSMVRQALTP